MDASRGDRRAAPRDGPRASGSSRRAARPSRSPGGGRSISQSLSLSGCWAAASAGGRERAVRHRRRRRRPRPSACSLDRATSVDPSPVFSARPGERRDPSPSLPEARRVPLAIELAAAGVRSCPLQIARRLGDRFRLLAGGRRTARAATTDLAGAHRLELGPADRR